MSCVMSKSPVALASSPAPSRAIRKTPAGRTMVSVPGAALAALMASRRVALAVAGSQIVLKGGDVEYGRDRTVLEGFEARLEDWSGASHAEGLLRNGAVGLRESHSLLNGSREATGLMTPVRLLARCPALRMADVGQSLFEDAGESPPQAARLAPVLHRLAERGIYFGTSSWKYEGWLGSIYSRSATSRGKVLAEEVRGRLPPRVRRDLPGRRRRLQLLPVPDGRDVARASSAARRRTSASGSRCRRTSPSRAGRRTPATASGRGWTTRTSSTPTLFEEAFLKRSSRTAGRSRSVIFEFGTFAKKDFAEPGDFLARLGRFLRLAAARLALCGRDPQRRLPRPRLLRRACRGTTSPTSSTPGRGCRPLTSRSHFRVPRHGRLHRRAGALAEGPGLRAGGGDVRAVPRNEAGGRRDA